MKAVTLIEFDSIPDIMVSLKDIKLIPFMDICNLHSVKHSRVLFILTGSGEYYAVADKSEPASVPRTYRDAQIFSINPGFEYIFSSTSKQTRILYIEYDLYACGSVTHGETEDASPYLDRRYIPLDYPVRTTAPYILHFPDYKSYIDTVIEMAENPEDNYEALRHRIEVIFQHLIETTFFNEFSVFHNLTSVAFEYGRPIRKMPFEIWVEDISIWSCDPNTDPKAELVTTFYTQHKFVEKPSSPDKYKFVFHPGENGEKDSCTFTCNFKDAFKLWFFPVRSGISISDIRKTGVIKFRISCNQPCELRLLLYTTPSYTRIEYKFTVTKADTVTEFNLPLTNYRYSSPISPPYVQKAVEYINENYFKKITVQDIADHVHIHPSYLSSLFRKVNGQSINNYINFSRINIAKQLLMDTDNSITDVALHTGFYDSQHFLKTFKKITGMTPTEFRNIHKQKK